MDTKLLLLLAAAGGVAYVAYGRKDKKGHAALKKSGGFYVPSLTTSGGLSRGEEILQDPSNLEGYFSTGACCSGCAQGRSCNS